MSGIFGRSGTKSEYNLRGSVFPFGGTLSKNYYCWGAVSIHGATAAAAELLFGDLLIWVLEVLLVPEEETHCRAIAANPGRPF